MTTSAIATAILNDPYSTPERHFEIASSGGITGMIVAGRRPGESFIPIAVTKKGRKGKATQDSLDFDATGERTEVNPLINDVRREVELWRARGYAGVTPYTRKLLQYWADSATNFWDGSLA